MRNYSDRNQQNQQLLLQQQKKQLEFRQRQQQQQHQRQQMATINCDEMLRRARPPLQAREQAPPLQEENQQVNRNAQQYSQFLKRKQRKNIILNEGDEEIPFTATREFFKYELFVTNLSADADIEKIKSHLVKMLKTDDIFIKCMSNPSAPYLSVGVFCRSQRNDLDFRIPGLWQRNTMIYKWKSMGEDTRTSNQGVSYQ